MRICLVGPSHPFRGGITHYTTLLYRHLRRRHETAFFSFTRQYPRWLFPGKSDRDNSQIALKEEGAEPTLDSMNPWSWYVTYRKIKAFRPEIVVIPWWVFFWAPQFSFLASLIKRHTEARILFLCHNVVEHDSRRLASWCTQFVLRRGDLFLVHSQDDLRNLKKMLPAATVRQSFHPSYDEFPKSGISRVAARRALAVDGNVIMFFGFVRPYKGLDYVLDALPRILAETAVTLLIVGEFWGDKERYLEKIENLGITGAVKIVDRYVPNEDVERYFAAADLLVMPYVSATGSGVVQLSFGFGVPVVVTQVGALPEVVKEGETGFIVPSRDAEALAAKVLHFFRNGMRETLTRNIEKDRHRFTWDNLVESIEQLAAALPAD